MERTLLSLAITPKTPADRERLARGLQMLRAESGELEVRAGRNPHCTVIGATSEAHLEELVDRLKRDFGVEASVGRPAVAYLETLTRSAEGEATHVAVAQGRGEYGHVRLRVHPANPGAVCSFTEIKVTDAIPKRFMKAVKGSILTSMANGVVQGYPIVSVRVEVYGGSYHETDSTDAAFRSAAASAFQDAAERAQPVVLEPIMQVVVRASQRHVSAVLDHLLRRRGEVQARTQEADQEIITAHVPLADLLGFEGHLGAETYGHVSCSIRFAHYQPVIQGPAADDDRTSRVGSPRPRGPDLRTGGASVPEPEDTDSGA